MSTPNFTNKNASKIYASECREEWDYEDLKENVILAINPGKKSWYKMELNKWEDGRDGGSIFASRTIYKNTYIITINLVARSGYYAGVNLDWSINVKKDSVKDYFNDEVTPWDNDNDLPAYINNILEAEVSRIEKVYNEYTTPLICKAIFSNGEAIYEKAN